MLSRKWFYLFAALIAVGAVCVVFPGSTGSLVQAEVKTLPDVPMVLPEASSDGVIYLPGVDGEARPTTLMPELQEHLTEYLEQKRSPIAAVVVTEVATGRILAMAQGRHPEKWEGKTHSALHTGFPAASLFKTVVAAAAFELGDMDPDKYQPLYGGCAHVRTTGVWLKEKQARRHNKMHLRRAYGKSCNGFFAKVAVNELGLGIITNFARRFGWETGFPTDFNLAKSPIRAPSPRYASAHTVGRYAAGFGYVGISSVHAAWMMQAIANKGLVKPMLLFADTPLRGNDQYTERLFRPDTADRLIDIMDATVRGGTASFAFRRGKTRRIRNDVGGKTGTLTGRSPQGLTTWFAGMMPLDQPEIVVAAVAVLGTDLWYIKGPNLAAEALWKYKDIKRQRTLAKKDSTN